MDDFHALDIEFHAGLLRNCGNPIFAELSSTVATVLRGRVEINMYPQHPEESALSAHEKVAQAVVAGDAHAAYEAMYDIVSEVNTAIGLTAM